MSSVQLDSASTLSDTLLPETPAAGFATLGLASELLTAVAGLGWEQPTEVQQRAIPLALEADGGLPPDLMVRSQTGSGKTAAFLLPMLQVLLGLKREAEARAQADWEAQVEQAKAAGQPLPRKPRRRSPMNPRQFRPAVPQALVLAPTRELAQQVATDAIDLVRQARGLRVANVVGGMPYRQQIAQLQNADLVVATPGRLLDLQRSGQIILDQVRFLVVDEADRMLDLGFSDELEAIHQLTAGRGQTMMFSATFAPAVQQLALRVMREGGAHVQRLEIDSPQQRQDHIRQELYWADNPGHKRRLLDYWLRDPELDQAIVFACTQVECDELAIELQQAGFAAVALHGAMGQGLRNRRLTALRSGRVQVLVATDVAARGIDVPTITHVINFGLPMKAEDYTHRIGRTGRAGRSGLALTLAEFRDRRRLADIERHTGQAFEVRMIEGLEPQEHFPPISQARKPAHGAGRRSGVSRKSFGSARRPGFGRDAERGPRRDFEPRGAERSFGRGPQSGEGRPGSSWRGKPARPEGHRAGKPGSRPARPGTHAPGTRARAAQGGAPSGRRYVPGGRS